MSEKFSLILSPETPFNLSRLSELKHRFQPENSKTFKIDIRDFWFQRRNIIFIFVYLSNGK